MKKLALLLGCVVVIVLLASFTSPSTKVVKHSTISKETAHGGMSTGKTHGTDW
jgi:hypothetical protein